MLRLLLTIILVGVIYIIGTLLVSTITDFVNNATLIVSGINRTEIKNNIRAYIEKTHTDMHTPLDREIMLEKVRINTDDYNDLIATVHTDETCGSGGCMKLILLNDAANHFTFIPFTYTVKSLEVINSVTNGMHDLEVNNQNTHMVWNGEQYQIK